MTEQEAKDDPEMITILLLSGYVRELKEGKDFEEVTFRTAKAIVDAVKHRVQPDQCGLGNCSTCVFAETPLGSNPCNGCWSYNAYVKDDSL